MKRLAVSRAECRLNRSNYIVFVCAYFVALKLAVTSRAAA